MGVRACRYCQCTTTSVLITLAMHRYAAGARIHSNSWGSPSPAYSIDACRRDSQNERDGGLLFDACAWVTDDVDMYAWQNKGIRFGSGARCRGARPG